MGYLIRGRIPGETANPLNRFLMGVYRPALEAVLRFPNATLLLYPEGNHVCNNIPYKYRPAMADWMRERLA